MIFVLILLGLLYFFFSGPSEQAKRIAEVINQQFNGVCVAKVEGSDTLRLDWTATTRKINVIGVMAAIGKSRDTIYSSGIRYLKFPNNVGGYNVIDWETGKKSSVAESARYYFRD